MQSNAADSGVRLERHSRFQRFEPRVHRVTRRSLISMLNGSGNFSKPAQKDADSVWRRCAMSVAVRSDGGCRLRSRLGLTYHGGSQGRICSGKTAGTSQQLPLDLSRYSFQQRPVLVTFVTAGYPTTDDTVPILLSMQQGGADIIELGVPFSDPIADGPAIQETNNVRTPNRHL
jgi:hypothetical protein